MVSTLDFESSNPSSNLGGTSGMDESFFNEFLLRATMCVTQPHKSLNTQRASEKFLKSIEDLLKADEGNVEMARKTSVVLYFFVNKNCLRNKNTCR